jgi:ATP-dependent RNA helicase DeaD
MNQRTIDLRKVKLLVLDEADRMLDMGFIKDVEKIIRKCPTNRQTLFFSATISTEIKNLANKYMKDPLTVSAVNQVDPSKLKQVYYNASGGLKLPLLVNLLKNEKQGLVMVFCNMRSSVDFVVKNLKKNKVDAMAIHGGLTQNKRTKMMDMFNGGKFGVLVCTDVAARGLHIDNVSHVYNYEIPRDAKDYVHRIGRTARAGEEGMVVNILAESDHENFSKVLREYNNFQIDKIDTPQLERVTIVKRDNFRPKGRFGNKGKFSNNGNGFRKNNGNSFRGGNRSRW